MNSINRMGLFGVAVLAGLLAAGQAPVQSAPKTSAGRLVFTVTADCEANLQSVPGTGATLKDKIHAVLTEVSSYDLVRYGARNPYFALENRSWKSTVIVDGDGSFVDPNAITVKWKYTAKQPKQPMCALWNDPNYFPNGPNEWKWAATIADFVSDCSDLVETDREESKDPDIAKVEHDQHADSLGGGAAPMMAAFVGFTRTDMGPSPEPTGDDPAEKLVYRFTLHKASAAAGTMGKECKSTAKWPEGQDSTGDAKITVRYSLEFVAPKVK